ncbi:ABC transporter substrate-binding protein [Martelella sp. HB161492]|uniref:ABC transporter substrate-binding protein n=1 Tax=Martelella sp. HB161492 TaxID=2720726 RepID=UPI0015906A00|nr:ABC transporter substrate-binding protein [Martelella sp. HB161492]
MPFTSKRRSGTFLTSGRALMMALALAAAGPVVSGAIATKAVADDQQPIAGGEMTIINGSDITSWDPALTNGTYPGGPMDVRDAIYGVLVYIDVNGKIQGGMAESLTSEDAQTWTLKLRPGITFSDGEAYDAEAVKYNWDRMADPETMAPTQAFVSSWDKSIKIIDPLTLTITLDQPNRNFGSQLAQQAPFIGSPKELAAAKQKSDIKPVGAGPFIFDSWDQGVSMTLKRNPNYWDQPRPYLDTLNFKIIPETNSRIATVVQGGATMMAGYPYQFGSNAEAPGVATHEIPIPGLYRAFFNQTSGPFTDVRARKAFYEAIDRSRLMQAYTQTGGYVTPNNYFTQVSPYYQTEYNLPEYNPEDAQKIFNELADEGKPFEMKLVTYSNSDLKRLASYVQQVMSAYKNVKVDVDIVDQAMLTTTCKDQLNFDLCVDGGVLVANGAEPTISGHLASDGIYNWGQYSNPKMDEELKAASATMDDAEVKADYLDVQKMVAEDLPLYIFGSETRFLLLRDNTGGIVPSDGGMLQKQYLYVCDDACQAKK